MTPSTTMKTQTISKPSGTKKAVSVAKKNVCPKPGDQMTDPVGDEENVPASSSGLTEDEIAARAYEIWQERGCPEGCDEENWQLAQEELAKTSSTALNA